MKFVRSPLFAVLLLVLGLGLGAFFLLFLKAPDEGGLSAVSGNSESSLVPWEEAARFGVNATEDVVMAEPSPAASLIGEPVPPYPLQEDEEPLPGWLTSINEVLNEHEPNSETAGVLSRLMPSLPPEGQESAALYIVALLDDADYGVAREWVLQPALAPEVMEVFFVDLLERPNALRFPILAEIAGVSGHPMGDEAVEILAAQTGQNMGRTPQAWAPAIQRALQQGEMDSMAEGPVQEETWVEVEEAGVEAAPDEP